jgi:glycosyltransferase involved in cell wall biosynthesis
LAEALALLAADANLPPLRLRAAGYLDSLNRPYLAGIQRQLAARGLAGRFEYIGAPDRAGKIAFLQSLDVMSLSTVYRESKGLPVLEAWANAVPVVVPRHGAFPEMVDDTGGGLLCRPDDPADLAAVLTRFIVEPELGPELGRRAQQAVRERYQARHMARQTIELYRTLGAARVPASVPRVQ